MATTTLRPAYDSQAQFSAVPAASGENFARVGDAGNDGTYNATSVAAIDYYGLTRPGNDIWVVSSVDLALRAAVGSGAGSLRGTYKLGGVVVNTTTQALTTTPTNYTWSAIARPGGGAWTGYDLASMLAGVEAIAGMTGEVRVYEMTLGVTHTVRTVLTPSAGTGMDTPTVAEPDPLRFSTTLRLTQTELYAVTSPGGLLTVARVILPGTTEPVFITLSAPSVTVANPPVY